MAVSYLGHETCFGCNGPLYLFAGIQYCPMCDDIPKRSRSIKKAAGEKVVREFEPGDESYKLSEVCIDLRGKVFAASDGQKDDSDRIVDVGGPDCDFETESIVSEQELVEVIKKETVNGVAIY